MILGFGHIRGFHGISVIRIPWIKKLQRIWHILYFVSHFHIIMFVSHYWHDLSSLNLFINHFLSLVRNLLNPLVTILSLLSFWMMRLLCNGLRLNVLSRVILGVVSLVSLRVITLIILGIVRTIVELVVSTIFVIDFSLGIGSSTSGGKSSIHRHDRGSWSVLVTAERELLRIVFREVILWVILLIGIRKSLKIQLCLWLLTFLGGLMVSLVFAHLLKIKLIKIWIRYLKYPKFKNYNYFDESLLGKYLKLDWKKKAVFQR